MYPVLFQIGDEPVPAYFTLLVLGFALATWLAARWAKRTGLSHDTMIDLGLYSLLLGVVGGRLLHVFADGYFWDYVHLCTNPQEVSWRITQLECSDAKGIWDAAQSVCRPSHRDCFAWAAFWNGGLAYYGGLLVVLPFAFYFLRKEKVPVLKAADGAGLVIPLGLFWGRMGCFLSGCCFGVETSGRFGVRFPSWSPASEAQWREGKLAHPHLVSEPVHPTQLYEAFASLAIAAALMFWLHPRKRFDGEILLAFLLWYAAVRFLLEFLRADDRGVWFSLSTSQWIGVGVMTAVVFVWKKLAAHESNRNGVQETLCRS